MLTSRRTLERAYRMGMFGRRWSPLSLGTSLAAWYSADVGCYTDAACLFASASSQYLSRASSAALQMGDVDFSYVFFVKPTDLASTYTVMSKGDGASAGGEIVVYVSAVSGTVVVYVRKADDSASVDVSSSAGLSAGSYAMVEVYHDKTTDVIGVRVNNGTAATSAIAGGVFVGASDLLVGSAPFGFPMNGSIGRVGFWKRLLTAGERTSLYNAGAGKFYADLTTAEKVSLVDYWNLCESSSTRVGSHAGLDLTAVNTPTVAAGPGEGLCVTNSPCKRIEDRSGNARHLVQATIAKQPLWLSAIQNGRPVLRFDGVDDVLVRNNGTAPWDADALGVSFFACAAQRDATTVGWVVGGSPSEGWSAEPAGGISFDTSRQPGASLYDGAAYRHVRGSAVSLGVFSSVVSSYDPADAFLRVVVDGTAVNGSHAMDATQSAIFMIVGRSSNPVVSYGFVDVAECGIGRLGLTAAGRAGAATYLKTRFATP